MSFSTWLRSWKTALSGPSRSRRDRCHRLHRLVLEPLEERLALSGWAVSTGTAGANDYNLASTVDSQGRTYVCGTLGAPADVDPGPGTVNATGTYIARYLSNGALDSSFGSGGVVTLNNSSSNASIWDVKVGTDGLYLVGDFSGTVDFDPANVNPSADTRSGGSGSTFLWKMTTDGQFQWVQSFGSSDQRTRMDLDSSNNIYLTGRISGPTDFDPSHVTPGDTPAVYGGSDVFVAKYDSSGAFQWASVAGGTANDISSGIAVSGTGPVYVTGFTDTTTSAATFGTLSLKTGANSSFVARLNSSTGLFDRLWQAGGDGIVADTNGNIATLSVNTATLQKLNGDTGSPLWSDSNLSLAPEGLFQDGPPVFAEGPDGSLYVGCWLPGYDVNNYGKGGDPTFADLDPSTTGKFELSNPSPENGAPANTGSPLYLTRFDGSNGNFLSTRPIVNSGVNATWSSSRWTRITIDPSNGDIIESGSEDQSPLQLDTGTQYVPTPANQAFVLRTTQEEGGIAGRLFDDLNGDGVRQTGAWNTGEWDLTGFNDTTTNTDTRWQVTLLDSANNVVQTTFVGVAGDYFFNHVPAGTYTVLVNARPGWTSTNHPAGSFPITLGAGQYVGGMDFGMSPGPATGSQQADPRKGDWAPRDGGAKDLITGLVWSNVNANALYSGTNTAIQGSTQNGFNDWRLGTKSEVVAAPHSGLGFETIPYETWTSTGTSSSDWVVNRVTGDAYLADKRNTYRNMSAMVRDSGTRIDDGTTGYADTGWSKKSSSLAQDGDYRTAAKGTGSQTATWTFTGLQPGAAYRVSASWLGASGNASNAPYKIYDGNTLLGTVSANQKVNSNEYVINDMGWQGLGTFRTTTGTLKIVLNNNADGTVVADSVRLFLVSPPSAGAPLEAAAVPASNPAAATLTTRELQPLVQEAAARWQAAGLTPQQAALLRSVDVQIADLGGATLGLVSGNTIVIDDNAAGWGWFVDPTRHDDSEFTTPGDQGEQGKMDLLTVLTHEMGHLLGLEHSTASGDVMNTTLNSGVRLMPTASDLSGSTLAGFSPSHGDDAGQAHASLRALANPSQAVDATDALFAELAQRKGT